MVKPTYIPLSMRSSDLLRFNRKNYLLFSGRPPADRVMNPKWWLISHCWTLRTTNLQHKTKTKKNKTSEQMQKKTADVMCFQVSMLLFSPPYLPWPLIWALGHRSSSQLPRCILMRRRPGGTSMTLPTSGIDSNIWLTKFELPCRTGDFYKNKVSHLMHKNFKKSFSLLFA